MLVQVGSTNVSTYFQLRNAADGTDATGKTMTDFDLQYVRSGAAPSTKADATALAAADSAHTDNAMIEVDATDTPGLHRIDWPDAAFAAGVREVILTVKHADIFTESLRVQLVGFDPASTTRGAAGTALPDAAADGAGGLPISDAGGLDLDARLDAAVSSRASQVSVDDLPTNAELAAALAAADDAVLAAIAALNNLSEADVRNAVGLAGADLDAQLAALASLIGDIPTNAELAAALVNVFQSQITESYAANGAAPTRDQLMMAVHQCVMHFLIDGAIKRVLKLNDSDTAFEISHDSATAPTSARRVAG